MLGEKWGKGTCVGLVLWTELVSILSPNTHVETPHRHLLVVLVVGISLGVWF